MPRGHVCWRRWITLWTFWLHGCDERSCNGLPCQRRRRVRLGNRFLVQTSRSTYFVMFQLLKTSFLPMYLGSSRKRYQGATSRYTSTVAVMKESWDKKQSDQSSTFPPSASPSFVFQPMYALDKSVWRSGDTSNYPRVCELPVASTRHHVGRSSCTGSSASNNSINCKTKTAGPVCWLAHASLRQLLPGLHVVEPEQAAYTMTLRLKSI